MAQYDMFQLSQLLSDGNNIYPRNEVYEKEINDLQRKLYYLEQRIFNEHDIVNGCIFDLNEAFHKNHTYMFGTDYLRRFFPHFPKIPFKVDTIPNSSNFIMIVHDGTGEDFCALSMRPCKYAENDGDKYFSHMELHFTK